MPSSPFQAIFPSVNYDRPFYATQNPHVRISHFGSTSSLKLQKTTKKTESQEDSFAPRELRHAQQQCCTESECDLK